MKNENYDVYEIFLMIAIISFLGFCLENFWLFFNKGYVDNRSMALPFLLGYGLSIAAFYYLLGTPKNYTWSLLNEKLNSEFAKYFFYFIVSFFAISIGEILLGTFIEKTFGFSYWSYIQIPLHVTKYTSVPTSLCFALIVTSFMSSGFGYLMNAIEKLPPSLCKYLGSSLIVLLLTDFVVSFHKMYKLHSLYRLWRFEIHGLLKK